MSAESTAPSTPTVARIAAAAASQVRGVVALHGGALGEIATYGSGGPVPGIRVRRPPDAGLRVHLVARFGVRLDELADEVRARVRDALADEAPQFADAPVDVHVADVRLDEDVTSDRAITAGRR